MWKESRGRGRRMAKQQFGETARLVEERKQVTNTVGNIIHIFDTSALLTHYFDERGADIVAQIFLALMTSHIGSFFILFLLWTLTTG